MERIGLTPGSEIGGYTVVAPLGSGGMGTVYRAVDGGGTAVALKLLHPHVGSDATVRARLLREVAALQRLRHPAVAAVLDAEADSTEAFLVTELVAGDTLTEHVRERGPLDADDLLALAEGLRDALAAVHAAGVVHRDLKPSNVLLTDDGPVLIDFGLAQGVDDDANLTTAGLVLGTPGYLAPELLDGGDPSPATDMWGWAALLAFAATGRDPFGSRPVEAVLARARAGDVDLAGVGPLTSAAVAGALRPVVAERTDPEDVVAALRAVAAEGDLPAGAVATVVLGAAGSGVADGGDADGVATTVVGAGDLDDPDDLDGDDLDDDLEHDGEDGPDDGWDDGRGEDDLATEHVARRPSPQDHRATTALAAPAAGAATVAPAAAPVNDGRTVAVPVGNDAARPTAVLPPTIAPHVGAEVDDDPDDAWIGDDLEAGDDDADDGPGYQRPPARRRWGSMLAIGLVVALAAMLHPFVTILVVVVLAVLVRTVGLAVETMHTRRERRGVRRSDVPLAVTGLPWYLLRAVLAALPPLLVGGAVVLIVGGLGWWLLDTGRWAIGGSPGGEPPQGTTARLVVAALTLVLVAFVWWGPLSRMTRTGARRTLALVAPGPVGALVVVVLALVGALLLFDGLVDAQPIRWWPLDTPPVLPNP
jgi:predicted Ser/Thr protein kinase